MDSQPLSVFLSFLPCLCLSVCLPRDRACLFANSCQGGCCLIEAAGSPGQLSPWSLHPKVVSSSMSCARFADSAGRGRVLLVIPVGRLTFSCKLGLTNCKREAGFRFIYSDPVTTLSSMDISIKIKDKWNIIEVSLAAPRSAETCPGERPRGRTLPRRTLSRRLK